MSIQTWKYTDDAVKIIQDLETEIDDCKRTINDGTLMTSPYFDREYSYHLGRLQGLNYINDLIQAAKREDLEDSIDE